MTINTVFKTALVSIFLVITLNIIAMDVDLLEGQIASMLEQPINENSINQIAKDIKLLSDQNPQKAAPILKRAFESLIAAKKFDLAQTLILNFEDVPALKNEIEQFEFQLVSEISAVPTPMIQVPKISEAEAAMGQASALLIKEPFTLADAKTIDNIIEAAITNNWKIGTFQLIIAFVAKSYASYITNSLDDQIITLLTETLKKLSHKSPSRTQSLIAEIIEKIITIPINNVVEKQRRDYFIITLLDSLLNNQIISQQEFDKYFEGTFITVPPAPQRPPSPVKPSPSAPQLITPTQPPSAIKPSPSAPQLQGPTQRPPSPSADSELAPIIKEHAGDKSALENKRIEARKEGDVLVNLPGKPTQFTIQGIIIVNIQQMPALTQLEYRGQSPQEVIQELTFAPTSNYCGYYAAYNIWCIITNQQNNIMNRKLFVEHFGSMLATIKKNDLEEIEKDGFAVMNITTHKKPYDELAGYEIEYLLKKEFHIEPSSYSALNSTDKKILLGSENVKADPARTALLKAFHSGPFNQEKMLPILFNVEANHWIAIKATRYQNTLSLEVYDSLGKRNWQDGNTSEPINTEILKSLATYLTTPDLD